MQVAEGLLELACAGSRIGVLFGRAQGAHGKVFIAADGANGGLVEQHAALAHLQDPRAGAGD